ncbi:ABC transporter substrate-binding protein [Paracoccus sp. NGMCC 1.201697]|uniref:ABC transporter substrate-binding protein n=1 Tax=Paracoccus broussonetiae subsp. drimophilus TaxID=3373869 RepID=A0ABW7LRL0_9RHOB
MPELRHLKGAALAGAALLMGMSSIASAGNDTSGKKIAFSNSFAGNSFRQVMVKSWESGTDAAKAAGVIGDAAVISANNNATEQAAQMQNLILEGYDAIVINAASPTALNGVVKQACDAGIVVVAFDGVVTEPCAYVVNYDWKRVGSSQVDYLSKRLGGKGTLLEVRGIAGNSVDDDISNGVHEALTAFPDTKIAGSVHGDFTQTVAQREVAGILPSLPNIDAVVTQGGDGYGTAQAFAAANRDEPIIIMGNREDELSWWKEQHDKNGYETMSISATPGVSMVAFWVAQQILAGKEVPKFVGVPFLRIDQPDLDAWLSVTEKGGVTNPTYTQEWVSQLIEANAKHADLPAIPAPTK